MLIAMALAGAMAINSCTHKAPALPPVSFSNDIMPIIQANCSINGTCHVGSYNDNGHIDLSDSVAYSTITSKGLISISNPTASLMYSEIQTGYMPKAPYGPLSANEITLILQWIQQGAKNN